MFGRHFTGGLLKLLVSLDLNVEAFAMAAKDTISSRADLNNLDLSFADRPFEFTSREPKTIDLQSECKSTMFDLHELLRVHFFRSKLCRQEIQHGDFVVAIEVTDIL